jgi:two-component sensor histidine kinase
MNNLKKDRKQKLIITLSILLIIGFLVTSLVSYYVARTSLRFQIESSGLPLTSDNIYSEIKRDLLQLIFISSFMANDTFLHDWILNGEKDVGKITKYLAEIKLEYNTLTSFFVSDKSRIYYQSQGILKEINPNEERDVWYFRVRDMEPEYEINIDPDMANNDTMTVFINYKVRDSNGNYIGATGIGLAIKSISTMMEEYSQKYDRNIYLVNRAGKILLHNLSFPNSIGNIDELPDLKADSENLLSSLKNSLSYIHERKIIHLNTRYISELDLYLFVEQKESGVLESLNYSLLMNLLICAIITVIVIYLTSITIKIYQNITQKQQEEITHKNEELQLKNSELEVAIDEKTTALDKNILLMSEMNHRVKNNLAVIQSLLRIQSKEAMDEKSRLVLVESESRLKSITHLHQMLSGRIDLSRINVVKYVHDLVDDITRSFNIDTSKIKIEINIEKIDLDMNIIIPFALILNELITNAFKYAFDEDSEGKLLIYLHQLTEDKVELTVQDDGVGLPDNFDVHNLDSLGTKIISLLIEQIKGELNYSSQPNNGTTFIVEFPKK